MVMVGSKRNAARRPRWLAGLRLSRGTHHIVLVRVVPAAMFRNHRLNSFRTAGKEDHVHARKRSRPRRAGAFAGKRRKQSRSLPRPVPRPPRQPLRQAKRRPPPPAMLVPGRRWARERRGSSSASSSVCPSPSPDTSAPPTRGCSGSLTHHNVMRQWPVPAEAETGHCRRAGTTSTRSNTSHRNCAVGVGRCKPTAWLALGALSGGEYVGCGVYSELFQGVGLPLGAGDELIEVAGLESGVGVGEATQCAEAGGLSLHTE